MARPKKATVEYFPHYVDSGKTLFTIQAKFGNNGYAFWFKLLEVLGKSEHHFYDCRDHSELEYILARTNQSDEKLALEILDTLSELGAINKHLWKNKIIWSENFRNNMSTVYSRREINVYNYPDVVGFCKQKYPLKGVSVDINPQSKVSKVKESKVKEGCGHFKNILLSKDEVVKLKEKLNSEFNDYIERISEYVESSGKKYKSHYATILGWKRKDSPKEGKTRHEEMMEEFEDTE